MSDPDKSAFEQFQAQVNALLTEAKLAEKLTAEEITSGLTTERLKSLTVEELKRLETVIGKILELENKEDNLSAPKASALLHGSKGTKTSIEIIKDLINSKINTDLGNTIEGIFQELADEIRTKGIPLAAKRATIKKLETWSQVILIVLLKNHMKGRIEDILARPPHLDHEFLKAHAQKHLRSFVPRKLK